MKLRHRASIPTVPLLQFLVDSHHIRRCAQHDANASRSRIFHRRLVPRCATQTLGLVNPKQASLILSSEF